MRAGRMGLLAVIVLSVCAACPAADGVGGVEPAAPTQSASAALTAAPAAETAAGPGAGHHPRQAGRLTPAQRIELSVRRLARGLELDPAQQDTLRNILTDQHRQILQWRSGATTGPTDVAGTTLAIYEHTRTRIRALLNAAQLAKYGVDVPHDELAPAQADLQHWMGLQEARRRQAQNEEVSP
ncbi:MAG: hypothetical protein KGI67_13850 [Pseudomonadota bacterium]|nr:hypothetical protein [Pseudomonadota bacterium]